MSNKIVVLDLAVQDENTLMMRDKAREVNFKPVGNKFG